MAATIENWDFQHVKPILVEYLQGRGLACEPSGPLDIISGDEPGKFVRRAFVALNPDYKRPKNLAADAHVEKSTVSRWYGNHVSEGMIANGIFPALCDAYVRAFCESEGNGFRMKHAERRQLAGDAYIEHYESTGVPIVEQVERAALSYLLLGREDPRITKSPLGLQDDYGLKESKLGFAREVLRLAAVTLRGDILYSLARTAYDYLELQMLLDEDEGWNSQGFIGGNIERESITKNIKGRHGYSDNAGEFEIWAKQFQRAWLDQCEDIDLLDVKEGADEAIARRADTFKRRAEEWQAWLEDEDAQGGS